MSNGNNRALDHPSESAILSLVTTEVVSEDATDAVSVVSSLVKMLRTTFGTKVDIEYSVATRPLFVDVAGAAVLQHVLLGLGLDACDSVIGANKVRVVVDARGLTGIASGETDSFVHVSVTDNGPGVNARASTRRASTGGGSGAKLASRLLPQAHGFITIDSHFATGETVHCYFPAKIA